MLRDATRRRFDVLLAWSVDRLARTLRELFATLAVLRDSGIDLYLKEQGVDTTAASGRALFETVGIFTELENALTRARVQAGVDRARKAGKPIGRPKIDAERADAIRASLAGGVSIRKAARLHHVGLSTVQRLKAALSGEASGSSPLPHPVVRR